MAQFNVLIVHGVHGYPQKNWYGSISEHLRSEGHNVVVPQFPTCLPQEGVDLLFPKQTPPEDLRSYEKQKLSVWCDIARKAIAGWNPERTILVGHSLGGLTVLRLAERAKKKPFHAVLAASPVGGPIDLPDCSADLKSFYEGINGEDIRDGARKIILFLGSDDSIVLPEQSKRLGKLCRADKVITIKNGGHLNADSGFITFPKLLQQLQEVIANAPMCCCRSKKAVFRTQPTHGEQNVLQR